MPRFKKNNLINFNGVETYGLWQLPEGIKNAAYTTYYVPSQYSGRPDLIANVYLNRADLYWVLIAFNAPDDIMSWPKTGDVIKIPTLSAVLAEL